MILEPNFMLCYAISITSCTHLMHTMTVHDISDLFQPGANKHTKLKEPSKHGCQMSSSEKKIHSADAVHQASQDIWTKACSHVQIT